MRPGKNDQSLDVLIIGAGFAGICLGKRLRDEGITNFRIIDQAPQVGGTWYWNSYPGAACDVLSHFYCYSFAPNPDWSRKYSPWNEIREYAERCVDRFGLREHLELSRTVRMAAFNDESRLWEIKLANGDPIIARHVIDGSGGLHEPLMPHIPGADSFAGDSWHSARWRHDVNLQGRNVVVIGSAASAVQIVPEISQIASRVTVFQRTANYVIPRKDRRFHGWERWCFRHVPGLARLYRTLLFLRYEWLAYPIVRTPKNNLQRYYVMWQFRRLLKRHIRDPKTREQLTPDYPIGCKRVLISDDYYASLNRENVELVTEEIECITSSGVRTGDGAEHSADVLIYATGFDTQGQHAVRRVTGPAGLTLSQAWADAPIAYQGCMVAGFPNYYFVTGPNTGVGSTSMIFMIEQSARLIIHCIRAAGSDGLIAPTRQAMRAYNDEIQAALAGTVWATSCSSWYKREDGRITTLYPYNASNWRRQHLSFHHEHFEIIHAKR